MVLRRHLSDIDRNASAATSPRKQREGFEMSNTLVRFGTSADESKVFALLTELMEGELVAGSPIEQSSWAGAVYCNLLTGERGSVIVFEVNGEVLGVVTSSYEPAIRYGGIYARMEELIVDDRARGTGAGMMLVKAAIEEAQRRGCRVITLYAHEHTRAFYEKAGFRYVGPELQRATAISDGS
jgi:ribosomal protein S18 acetylase RimI-like enzyme